jgi:hypothetical protein
MIAEEVKNTLKLTVAGVVELADAPDSKSGGGNSVWVRLPPPAPIKSKTYEISCFSSMGVLGSIAMVL